MSNPIVNEKSSKSMPIRNYVSLKEMISPDKAYISGQKNLIMAENNHKLNLIAIKEQMTHEIVCNMIKKVSGVVNFKNKWF